jgi:penicillin-binding protein 1C
VEILKAFLLEKKSSKKEILENYLNSIFYGNLSTGIESASTRYFGVSSGDLSLAQSALLAGIPKSPVKYNPLNRQKNAFSRQKIILRRMLDFGFINEELYRLALSEKMVFKKCLQMTSAVQFANRVERNFTGRKEIKTTLDLNLNEELREILASHLDLLESNDVTNGSILIIDNRTGEILAWVGSVDYFDTKTQGQNDGVTALRQPGSALKPFLYVLAFSKGFKPSDMIDDSPVFTAGKFRPKNYDETYHGPVSVRNALACSYNIPAVYITQQIGPDSLLSFLRYAGFESLKKESDFYGAGLALGNGEVTLLELVNAYATLARGGIWKPVKYIYEGENVSVPVKITDRESVYLVTNILSDNSARADAFGLNSPLNLPFEFASKTGTTKDYRDNWAVGYTPEWTIGVWVGNFNGSPMKKVSGITGSAPVLRDAAILMHKRYPSGWFEKPRGITEVEICPDSGLLKSVHCPSGVLEVFYKKNMPEVICTLHRHKTDDNIKEAFIVKPEVEFPKDGDVFKVDPQVPVKSQAILFRSNLKNASGTIKWFVDSKEIYSGENIWWHLQKGPHSIKFSIQTNGRTEFSKPVRFFVIE